METVRLNKIINMENVVVKYEPNKLQRIEASISIANKLLLVNLRGIKILHLDDHISYSKNGVFPCILKVFPNAKATFIQNGDEALKFVEDCIHNNVHLDLIITDVNHGGLDGISFLETIKKA